MGLTTVLICASLTAVDGDTVKCGGDKLRPMGDGAPYVSGFDTPEIRQRADCEAERELGMLAMARMAELIQTPGLVVLDSGEVDIYDRPLVWLRLPDGSTVGEVLMREGFAVRWTPGYRKTWCD